MDEGRGPLTNEKSTELIEAIEHLIGEETGFVCVAFDTTTGKANLVSNVGPKLVIMQLLAAAIGTVEDFSEDERVDVLH